jgi:hypothetical protein
MILDVLFQSVCCRRLKLGEEWAKEETDRRWERTGVIRERRIGGSVVLEHRLASRIAVGTVFLAQPVLVT